MLYINLLQHKTPHLSLLKAGRLISENKPAIRRNCSLEDEFMNKFASMDRYLEKILNYMSKQSLY